MSEQEARPRGRPRKVESEGAPGIQAIPAIPEPVVPSPEEKREAQETYLADYKAKYDALLAEKVERDNADKAKAEAAKPKLRKFRCRVCDHTFESTETRPACKQGCNYPFEKRTARGDFITTELV